MSIELCVLASGSSGNCSVVRTPTGVMLIDAGIGPRVVPQRLRGTGVTVADVSAICLTHLDRDHFSPSWINTLVRNSVTVHCHANRVADLFDREGGDRLEPLVRPFEDGPFEPLPDLSVRPIPLAHDAEGSHGFVLDGFGCRIGYATDLGHVPDHLIAQFESLDLLALESNYDPQMQRESSRPWFLKQRIMGGKGHLSNDQALAAVKRVLDRAQSNALRLPSHIVLLHRSRQCNCPNLVRRLFTNDPRIAPRLVLSEQFTRTDWLRPKGGVPLAGEQLVLAWG
jgi:phosphoribosyl 1,2-cyclic phosphodiesterase